MKDLDIASAFHPSPASRANGPLIEGTDQAAVRAPRTVSAIATNASFGARCYSVSRVHSMALNPNRHNLARFDVTGRGLKPRYDHVDQRDSVQQ